jgi:hypothetical protein
VTETVSVYAIYPGAVREAKPSNGVFTYQEAKVTFDRDAVDFDVKPRDRLDIDGVTWTVKQSQVFDFLRFWDLQVFRLVAQADLCDTIAVYRPTVTATAIPTATIAVRASSDPLRMRRKPPRRWRVMTMSGSRVVMRAPTVGFNC